MEELLQRFSFDVEFIKWYEKRKMSPVEQHYRRVLHSVSDPDFQKILLNVVKKWLDDAYLNFGLETGRNKIIFCPITESDLYQAENKWNLTEKQLRFAVPEDRCINFPVAGLYSFYHYFVEIMQTAGQIELYTGMMPENLLKMLIHYLVHRFTVPAQPLGT